MISLILRHETIAYPTLWLLVWACALWPIAALSGSDESIEWPQFRGSARSGISQETGLLKSWPTNGPALLWTYDRCGVGYSGVVISKGKVFTAGTHSNGTEVIALNLEGKRLWSAPNASGQWRVPKNKTSWASRFGGSRSTPTVWGNMVFHLGLLGRLVALELETGKEIWAVDFKERFNAEPNEWGYSESVIVDRGRLYCLPGGDKGCMVCLDAATGETIWLCNDIPDKKASNASATLIEIEGVRQVITMTSALIVGVGAEDGELLWHVPHSNHFKENCEVPQFVAGILYVSSGYKYGSEAYRVGRGEGGSWHAERMWHQKKADNLHGGPIILDGFIYAAGYDFRGGFCIDLQTGALKWEHRKGIARSSYTFAEGLLYRLGEDGVMAIERPKPDAYHLVSRFKIPSVKKPKSLTHPVVCGKRLYIRHQQRLYCYDVGAE